jgi:FMN phosphatase YigB (HAD superfamily)
MKIIFDLDYTLLDTKKFKDKLADIFNPDDFAMDYKKYFRDKKINFNLEAYLALLEKQGKIDDRRFKKLKLNIGKLMNRLDGYLFTGADPVLSQLKENGAELILITFGDRKWQAEKVNNLSIKKYFSQIGFEDKDKQKSFLLKSLKNCHQEVLIVNDNAREAKEMAEIIGNRAKVFLVDGPYSNNIKHAWPIKQLNELVLVYDQK